MNAYQQIQNAVDLIEHHLQQELGIREIAAAAGYSSFHFQRMFQAISGFSVQEYIRKRRLTEAGRLLLDSEEGILPIALNAGYQSQEAFTRAFESYTGTTPGKFRQNSAAFSGLEPISFIGLEHRTPSDSGVSRPDIVRLERRIVIGYEYPTHLNDGQHYREIPGFYDDFGRNGRFSLIPGRLAPDMAYGVACGFKDDGGFSFVVGELCDESAVPPGDGYVKIELPAGTYAEFKAFGHADLVERTRNFIYSCWLPGSNYTRGDGPDFEITDVMHSVYPDRMRIRIFIPLL
ncbi:Right origin-binding protein [compost metagenome]